MIIDEWSIPYADLKEALKGLVTTKLVKRLRSTDATYR